MVRPSVPATAREMAAVGVLARLACIIAWRNVYIGTVLGGMLMGPFLKLYEFLFAGIDPMVLTMWQRALFFILGQTIMCVGISVTVSLRFGLGSTDAIIFRIIDWTGWHYKYLKMAFDATYLILGFVMGGVLVPGTATALPLFLVFSRLGLTNSYLAVLIPAVVSPFGLFLCRIYADSAVPSSLIEAARLDGAGELAIFHRIGLRQMTPSLVTVFLFQFVAIWNNYFLPLIMLADDRLYPVTLGLNTWLSQTNRLPQYYQLTIGGALLSIIPLAILMLILQRFWKGGLTEGAVKE